MLKFYKSFEGDFFKFLIQKETTKKLSQLGLGPKYISLYKCLIFSLEKLIFQKCRV